MTITIDAADIASDIASDIAPLLDVVGADLEVPLVTGGTARSVYLDHAASAPALAAANDAVAALLPWYGSVHRGAGFPSTVCNEVLERARHTVGRFVGARDDDTVVFTRNTTDALNLLAGALPFGTGVLTLDLEHHANLLPWRAHDVVHLATPRSAADVPDVFDAALRRAGRVPALVAVTAASNVTGETLPIAEIAAVAHRHGARIVVDAAQIAPHRGIDLAAADVDYLALSGHKLYAPYGAGVLVGRSDWLDGAAPHLAGGGAVRHVTLDDVAWATGPARHEGGTPNLLGAAALAAACATLSSAGWEAVAAHDAALTARLVERLRWLGGIEVLSAFGPDSDRVGIVSFVAAGRSAAVLAAALSAEHGIATREGAFCAHPLLRRLRGVAPDAPVPGALRVSVGVSTSGDDIDRLGDALASLLDDGPLWTYEVRGGQVVPVPDPRPRPATVPYID